MPKLDPSNYTLSEEEKVFNLCQNTKDLILDRCQCNVSIDQKEKTVKISVDPSLAQLYEEGLTTLERLYPQEMDFDENEEEVVVASVPLLFEANMQNMFDRTILVCADKKIRLQRLMTRRGYPLEHAIERINSQVSQEEKRNMADFIIENNNNLIELETQIEKTLERLWS